MFDSLLFVLKDLGGTPSKAAEVITPYDCVTATD